ncbi:MAG: helix-turn-helix domain-containing protein [Curvibacter lanceolatus]|jgi:DNA-binding XRE family transcriptional regulator|uniref:helix-turn-helix domain-containing protein n=1 Tax=Curvibacter lanceolatus TaxID=86182 RepID=UPI00037391E1|nr:helix-turn-helix domain-containing protein [Curvibacter lanceolatus]MBV5294883.1 helix-turn-helix domain-containing protein [Curvibacter lanceolatus]
MDKRIKHKNPERDAALRRELFEGVMRNQLSLGEAVKLMQKVSRLTQAEFAAHRGVSIRVLKEIIAGSANPTVETLNKIASIFGLEVGFVAKRPAGEEGEAKPPGGARS